MTKNNRYNIFTKMREILQAEPAQVNVGPQIVLDQQSIDALKQILTKGVVGQIVIQEMNFNIGGDNFENVSQAVITTGGSTASIKTGEIINSFQQARTTVDAKQGINTATKDEIKRYLTALEEELKKDEPDAGNIQRSWNWIKRNANWVVPTLTEVVIEGMKKCFGAA